MKRTIFSLLFLLLVQLALVALLYRPDPAGSEPTRHLLSNATALQVDSIRIGDNRDSEVLLSRVHGRWVLPDLQDLPADGERIRGLLGALAERPLGFPVAESAAARQRFRVASYHYHRRLVFSAGDNVLETVYLGRSPAYRMVYARNDKHSAIYRLRYNNHDAPVEPDAWLDTTLAAIAGPQALRVDGLELRRLGDGPWRTANGREPDPRELAALLEALASLTVHGLADEDTQRSLAQAGQPVRRIRAGQDGRSITLELFRDGERYYLHDSRYSPFFKLSKKQFLRLAGVERQRLGG